MSAFAEKLRTLGDTILPRLPQEIHDQVHALEIGLGAEILQALPYNIVTISATGVGAGHERQRRHVVEFLQEISVLSPLDHITEIVIPQLGEKPDRVAVVYKASQQIPPLQEITAGLIRVAPALGMSGLVTKTSRSMANPDALASALKASIEAGTYDPQRPTLFITTHMSAGYALYEMLKDHPELAAATNNVYVEMPPDPLDGGLLMSMAVNPEVLPQIPGLAHYVIVHDVKTMQAWHEIYPKGKTHAVVLPLGTSSEPTGYAPKEAVEPVGTKGYQHVVYETSGNPIEKNDQAVIAWIRANAKELQRGTLRFTAHCMHHRSTRALFRAVRDELEAQYPGIRNHIEIIHETSLEAALISREATLSGTRSRFGVPDIILTKGGEVPIENRHQHMCITTLPSRGHERTDALAGKEQHNALLLHTDPRYWTKQWRGEIMRREIIPPPVINFAFLGVLVSIMAAQRGIDGIQEIATHLDTFVEALSLSTMSRRRSSVAMTSLKKFASDLVQVAGLQL